MQAYREMVFVGSLPVVRAFLAGLRLGRRWAGGVLFAEEIGVASESRGHRLLERLRLERELTHVLVEERYARAVTAAARAAPPEVGIALRLDRRVQGASFEYRFEVYNRTIAVRIRRLLAQRPAALTVEDSEEREEAHPEDRGTEVYTPTHDYVCAGHGTIRGSFADTLQYRSRLAMSEWLTLEKVRLQFAR